MMMDAMHAAGLGWLLTFLAQSSAILGGLWLAERLGAFGQRGFPEVAWRVAVVVALAAALPAAARFGASIELAGLTMRNAAEVSTAHAAAVALENERIAPATTDLTAAE